MLARYALSGYVASMTDTQPGQSISIDQVPQELRIAFFRRGISQQTAAERSGISPSAISRRLNGEISPTLVELGRLADAADLDVSVEFRARAS